MWTSGGRLLWVVGCAALLGACRDTGGSPSPTAPPGTSPPVGETATASPSPSSPPSPTAPPTASPTATEAPPPTAVATPEVVTSPPEGSLAPTSPVGTPTPEGPTATEGPTAAPTPGATPVPTPAPTLAPDRDGDGFTPGEGDCDDDDLQVYPGAAETPYNTIDEDCDGADLTDVDGDGHDAAEVGGDDCDDQDINTYPGAPEFEDDRDNDCDEAIDEELDTTDDDQDGSSEEEGDCNDGDATIHPDAEEQPYDGVDQDCDGADLNDLDGDGFVGAEAGGGDCDDLEPAVHPGQPERCNGIDDNCDGTTDQDAEDRSTFYLDADGDGFGDPGSPVLACGAAEGLVEDNTDCDDGNADTHPGAPEICDEQDNTCNGVVDEGFDKEGDEANCGTCGTVCEEGIHAPALCVDGGCALGPCEEGYYDLDGAPGCEYSCTPTGEEICDQIDNNCDGQVDNGAFLVWYLDGDGDGYGDAGQTAQVCDAPSGYVADAGDCDDGDGDVHPGQAEVCDGVDQDCDGATDEGVLSTWYEDADDDGYGDEGSTTEACAAPAGYVDVFGDCDDTDASANPGGTETCDGADQDCDEVIDNEADVCGSCSSGTCPVEVARDGSTSGLDLKFQYAPVAAGAGYVKANWDPAEGAVSYRLRIGSSAGAGDVLADVDVGAVTSYTAGGLSLAGAWTGARYYVTVTPVGELGAGLPATSNGVGIAEAVSWDGVSTAGLSRGFTSNWPASGYTSFYGDHYFESVNVAAGTVVYVQGFGKVDNVPEGVGKTDSRVTSPRDGWLALYANAITIEGTITASGRGYGGGGGGGAGGASIGQRGRGGIGGLGGNGGPGEGNYTGGGGGGSPFGVGGTGAEGKGGDGSFLGGGSGSTACSGTAGRSANDGPTAEVGGQGGTAASGQVGAGGAGEFAAGGANGVAACDSWSGGGGGGYGAGGGGGTQWTGFGTDAGGGGGGGTGGSGGGESGDGAAGAGPFGGTGGVANVNSSRVGQGGAVGGYRAGAANGDTSTDRALSLGSGGGGGGAGYQEASGGGGGAGGGYLVLWAQKTLTIGSGARVLANGAGGGGGGRDNGGNSTGAGGGVGGGGGLLFEAGSIVFQGSQGARVSARGGGGATSNGGTIKIFYGTLTGAAPTTSQAGRIYDAGAGSFQE